MPPTWQAAMITADSVDQAPLLRTRFTVDEDHGAITSAVLHLTALGVVEAFLDGEPVAEDVLTPGWSSYEWRLRYRTLDLAGRLSDGEHVLGLALGNGWARGRLAWQGGRAYYTDELGGFAQLEIQFADGHRQSVATDTTWQAHPSATLADDLYDGQIVDARLLDPTWATVAGYAASADGASQWSGVRQIDFDTTLLTEHLAPPVRRHEVLPAQKVWTSPSGRTLVDFGQNLVGWVRFTAQGEAGQEIRLRHAEVLEDGELGVRPLRTAKATDRFILSGGQDTFEPTMTFHGFRYVEVDGWPGELRAEDLQAVVVHSAIRRIGEFECSDDMLNQLHRNVVWGQKGNFLDVPSDCPQRDERLGWTGDIAVFGPTAAYLFDVADFLRDWLRDVDVEQRAGNGLVPFVVPDVLKFLPPVPQFGKQESTAIWSDVAVWLPWALWQAYGDRDALAEAYPLMTAHVDRVEGLLSPSGLWDSGFQFGDWLDPDAAPDRADDAKADKAVVATASAYRTASTMARASELLGHHGDARRFSTLANRLRAAFHDHYVRDDGTIHSDCTTVYALAIEFGLLDGELLDLAGARLAVLVDRSRYRISTGFAGTPYITDALTTTGHLDVAYRLLMERECPSWLYPVTMGATTIWERWDSMLPDGTINPGGMTSFNHYALGAVADWMHRVIAGLSPLEPGYSRALIAPRPGGGLTWARGSLQTPHGRLAVDWRVDGDELVADVTIPAGTTAVVRLPGCADEELAAGQHFVKGRLELQHLAAVVGALD